MSVAAMTACENGSNEWPACGYGAQNLGQPLFLTPANSRILHQLLACAAEVIDPRYMDEVLAENAATTLEEVRAFRALIAASGDL